MSTDKHFDKICYIILAFTLVLTTLFMNAEKLGIQKSSTVMGYEKKLFDTTKVHTINIIMEDWDDFIDNCTSEEYYNCTVVIDNEAYKNVAIRAKGNTSLSQVAHYGNDRYSFKIEFDHYDSNKTYYGLDKLCLNNIIQDNTYMKDYLCYQMMNKMGVASPLCSYVYITVNGQDWGLYLAVEAVEESFLQRNYGKNYGELYKPDSTSMGAGRGNGQQFNMDEFFDQGKSNQQQDESNPIQDEQKENFSPNSNETNLPDNMTPPSNDDSKPKENTNEQPKQGERDNPNKTIDNEGGNRSNGSMLNSSEDVLLKYIDDNYDSYSNIFENAKTDISDTDKSRLIDSLKSLSTKEDLENTVDIDKVIRYFVVHNFVLNFDSYTGSMIHNYYLYEEDGQLQMIPWDYNLAFGGFQSSSDATSLVNYPIDSPISGGSIEDRPMLAWIFSDDTYTGLYHQYFEEFIAEYFDSGYFSEMIDDITELISPYVEKDPTKFCTYEEFKQGVTTLKSFCLLRAESVSQQLNGKIGTTADTQIKDTLIDASEIQIDDMGTMNNSTNETSMQKPDQDIDQKQNSTESTENPFDNQNENPTNMPKGDDSNPEDNSNRIEPSQNNSESQNDGSTSISSNAWILLVTSILVLSISIIFAFLFKRRKV